MSNIKKIAKRIKPIRRLVEERDALKLQREDLKSKNHLLEENIKDLNLRNDQWAEEVRELRGQTRHFKVLWPASKEEIQGINQQQIEESKRLQLTTPKKSPPPYVINWVIPPGSPKDGGIVNIFRFIKFLESKGHKCRVYMYDPMAVSKDILTKLQKEFSTLATPIVPITDKMEDCDAIFATSWTTAYPVFHFNNKAKKFYFVQDFEPYFFPVGAESNFAENTYRFGFHGITGGAWLAQKLTKDYSMKCDYYNFGSDTNDYTYTNSNRRQRIIFYARPVSPRRGFELGVAALELFQQMHPDYEIDLVGWDLEGYELPFKFNNLKSLPLNKLSAHYNQCAAGLVISFTNMSLMPLELMAAGCIPVVNDQDSNKQVSNNPYIEYVKPYPKDIAERLSKIVTKKDLPIYAKTAADSASSESWDDACIELERVLVKELRG